MAGAFERYVEALGGPPRAELVEFAGRGGLRLPLAGRLGLWLGLRWEAYLVPCREFVWVGRARLLGLPLLRGGDEFKDGRGRLRVGRRVLTGDGYDRAEYAALWAWTLLLAPQAALARPDVVVEPAGGDVARVDFRYGSETWECTLRFDPESGLFRSLETHRFEPRSERLLRWSTEVERWGVEGGRPKPELVLSRWQGEPAVRLAVERLEVSAAGTG